MLTGLSAGVFWALDTVILGIAMSMNPFVSNEQALFLAPFVSTFMHDFCSSLWMLLYTGVTKQFKNVVSALKTRSGKFILLAAVLGGPIGMSGYVAAIKYIGPGYTAVISSMYPALGALFSFVFLKEKMRPFQIAGLAMSVCGVIVMGYSSGSGNGDNFLLGFICALICCVGWAAEGVICTYGMRDPSITNAHALQLRQLTSSVLYAAVILPVIGGWGFTFWAVPTKAAGVIFASAFFGTASYLCYYKALGKLGVSKAMPLNITYSTWSLVFSLILLRQIPDIKSIVCGIVIIIGSLLAAAEKGAFLKNKQLII